MMTASVDQLRARAERAATIIRAAGVPCDVVTSEAAVGGGAFPTARLESAAITFDANARDVERKLRTAAEPIIGRIIDGRLRLDLRSIAPEQDDAFAAAVVRALA